MLSFVRDADWLTLKRAERISAVFAVGALLAVGLDFWMHSRHGVINAAGEHLGRDFVSFWAGGRAVLDGNGAKVLDVRWFWAFERSLVGAGSELKLYSYPPVGQLLMAPIGLFPYVAGLVVWLLGSAAGCVALLSRSVGWRRAAIATFGAPAVMINALTGQNGAISAILMGGALIALPRRPVLAGVLFGLLCYKPQLALIIPIALAAGGYWRTILAAAVTVALLVGASAAVIGPGAWVEYVQHTTPLHRALLEEGAILWHRMPTAFALGRLLGLPPSMAYLIQGLSTLPAIAAAAAVWRGKASGPLKGAAMIFASMLASPYAWDYDLVTSVFAVVWLAVEWGRTGFRPWEKSALLAVSVMPVIMGAVAQYAHLQLGPILLWAILLLIVRRALTEPVRPVGPDAPFAGSDPLPRSANDPAA